MASDERKESSTKIRERVEKARRTQRQRFQDQGELKTNSEMNNKKVKKFCSVGKGAQSLLKIAVEEYNLSARSYFRVLKVARTIADLEDESQIQKENVSEAIQLRVKNEDNL
jgi:magnesium chelatase family protein